MNYKRNVIHKIKSNALRNLTHNLKKIAKCINKYIILNDSNKTNASTLIYIPHFLLVNCTFSMQAFRGDILVCNVNSM